MRVRSSQVYSPLRMNVNECPEGATWTLAVPAPGHPNGPEPAAIVNPPKYTWFVLEFVPVVNVIVSRLVMPVCVIK